MNDVKELAPLFAEQLKVLWAARLKNELSQSAYTLAEKSIWDAAHEGNFADELAYANVSLMVRALNA